MLNGDSDDFRKFVRVPCDDQGFHRRVTRGPGLDRHRHFLRSFDLAAPVIK
jgi:hypothetical protein